ncbi:bifunctional DNA primase/polymerase [Spongiactinospora sp. TRM90649]|uniref:bifunctional DNA primase/polymerase n=1 Tax=Spongiactinospora sp. TRM90649 TaxID=3031114 RepID=UPI0023F6BCCC|nr:bifunctional DNA primase/polymerase [Spongiactinospora sp. TRM90649]MDF5759125.1 bifunctional DNA primase/polymerase [Spongiactinospora sp. TRM90649]
MTATAQDRPHLAAALRLAGRGLKVFPCIPGRKQPIGRLVPDGFLGASADIELVSRWWAACPDANIGLPTGDGSFDVLDVDVKPEGTGYPALNRLKAAAVIPPPLAVVATPSGGLHCYYPGTAQRCGSLKARFLDFKAAGGYVLVPPSIVDGTSYRLMSAPATTRDQLNWAAVRAHLTPAHPARPQPATPTGAAPMADAGIGGLARWLSTRTKPGRNQALFWAACRAIENGARESDLHRLYAAMRFGDGFDERQAARTVADAMRALRPTA